MIGTYAEGDEALAAAEGAEPLEGAEGAKTVPTVSIAFTNKGEPITEIRGDGALLLLGKVSLDDPEWRYVKRLYPNDLNGDRVLMGCRPRGEYDGGYGDVFAFEHLEDADVREPLHASAAEDEHDAVLVREAPAHEMVARLGAVYGVARREGRGGREHGYERRAYKRCDF